MDDAARQTLLQALAWQQAMGAYAAVAEALTDWLARGDRAPGAGFEMPVLEPAAIAAPPTVDRRSAPPPGSVSPIQSRPAAQFTAPRPLGETRPAPSAPATRSPAPASSPPRQFPTAAPDAVEVAARTAARSAKTLDELGALLATFDGCGLKATAKNLCFYRGAQKSRVMLIGEAPGSEEDREGKPFVGPAGRLLDKMLAAIALGPDAVHVTNVVYWRPPGNRTPTPQETQVCRPFLVRQVELVAPEIVVLLGGAAAKHILDVTEGIMRVRGKWQSVTMAGHTARAIATLPPAHLLRSPAAKRLAWRDLLAVKAALAQPPPG